MGHIFSGNKFKTRFWSILPVLVLTLSLTLAACGDNAPVSSSATTTTSPNVTQDDGSQLNPLVSKLATNGITRFYVTVEGTKQGKFKGESLQSKNANKIDGIRFSYGITSPRDAASGLATGKRLHKPISFTKEWGAATPQFFQAMTTNENLKSVLFEFTKTNANGEEYVYFTIKLTNANIANINYTEDSLAKSGDPSNGLQLEEISVTFQKIEIENKDGKTIATDDWSVNN
ncbi:MAG: type VI secretion system tube protein Hcp [Chloroflexi bacterium]|uniref:Type VI secretion system tube protein Hcp n=1 Tax=Candidatus Chlorohelix allophototropha TaxID=3003348 RepID=A0A8T7M5X8_9CHLR|nr:type VI secretion system tube protein Hcp [Chloroflexota bacterium]WJW69358.1 type VI secretion system tube protein Hcp [Chloroflexota bacterium L227-S17]